MLRHRIGQRRGGLPSTTRNPRQPRDQFADRDLLKAGGQDFDHIITDPPYEAEAHSAGRQVSSKSGRVTAPLAFLAITEAQRSALADLTAAHCNGWLIVFCQSEGVPKWRSAVHQTQNPVRFMSELVSLFTNPGDVILDPFMGFGSTGVACMKVGRRFIGVELDAGHFSHAERRLAGAEGQFDLFVAQQPVEQSTLEV